MYPAELLEARECDEVDKHGLWTYSTQPPDSERCTVGVVPYVAFQHLLGARTDRHSHDDESEPKEYSGASSNCRRIGNWLFSSFFWDNTSYVLLKLSITIWWKRRMNVGHVILGQFTKVKRTG